MLNRMLCAIILSIMFILFEKPASPATTKVGVCIRLPSMNRRLTKVSKYLSFVLQHHPEKIGLKLDAERWATVDQLVKLANSSGKSITLAQVRDVVALDQKKMFALSDDGLRIRAS